jgi:hypothetical protein
VSSYSTTVALQRCDRCGALPRWRVVVQHIGVLRFCAHHFRQHELALTAADYVITEVPTS